MKIPCKQIARVIETYLKEEVQKLKKKGKYPHLVTILVGESAEQLSFVAIKEKTAKKLGIKFEFIHIRRTPSFESFAHLLKEKSHNPKVTGILIQQPLPSILQTDSVYNFIPLVKEIEGHKLKSPFHPPLGLAALTALKYVFGKGTIDKNICVNPEKDKAFFKNSLKHKRIVIAGRGLTGGQPIGKCFSYFKINYLSVNSQTYNPQDYYRDADIVVTTTGKKIITPDMLKPGVILVNVGLRKENGSLRGDYDEKEIEKIASHYTETPGGVGPIDVLYLYNNVMEAAKMQ